MIVASIVFGAVRHICTVIHSEFRIRECGIFYNTGHRSCDHLANTLSDGMWHPKYMVSVLSLLVIASFVVAFGPQVGAIIFYGSAILIGMTQAMAYRTLTSYLSFVLPKVGRNMLLGLFIACADLGISLGCASFDPFPI